MFENVVLIGRPAGLEIERVVREVHHSVDFIIGRSDKDRTGGYFTLLHRPFVNGPWVELIHCLIGKVRSDKFVRYSSFSKEKATRLAEHVESGHLTSWQSRDPEQDRWGGSVVTSSSLSGEQSIFSFSGLPELADEAAMIMAIMHLGMLSYEDSGQRAKLSNNRLILDLSARAFFGRHPNSK